MRSSARFFKVEYRRFQQQVKLTCNIYEHICFFNARIISNDDTIFPPASQTSFVACTQNWWNNCPRAHAFGLSANELKEREEEGMCLCFTQALITLTISKNKDSRNKSWEKYFFGPKTLLLLLFVGRLGSARLNSNYIFALAAVGSQLASEVHKGRAGHRVYGKCIWPWPLICLPI